MFGVFKRRRRRRLRERGLDRDWLQHLTRNVPIYRALPESDRTELGGHIRVLLAEKRFEGCGGFEVGEECRVTIAALAGVLLLRRDTDYYPGLGSVLVYPDAFVAPVVEETDYGVVHEYEETRLGEAFEDGAIALSWADIRHDARHPHDGVNLVLHEFAHQLDLDASGPAGVPQLATHRRYEEWTRVLGAEYTRLRTSRDRGRRTLIDTYGGEDPAEFFAVATECFFERPRELRRRHRELYSELASFYRQDPAREHAGY